MNAKAENRDIENMEEWYSVVFDSEDKKEGYREPDVASKDAASLARKSLGRLSTEPS
jgi:hypothetical protein